MKLSNGRIAWIVVLLAFVLLVITSAAPTSATAGFEAGRRLGYVFGQALLVGLVVWAILKYGFKRRV